jgi:2-polyprenyl-3-methyl-5-hydroxy-6-metoxy-1,4-benzoquinol methylase
VSVAPAQVDVPAGFELIDCPACGGARWSLARTGRDWARDPERILRVVRCDDCGLHYTNPRPLLSELGAYYTESYAPYRVQRGEIERSSSTSTKLRTLVLRNAFAKPSLRPTGLNRALAVLLSLHKRPANWGFAVKYRGQGRLLDFGCGNGTFLRRMAALGWNVTGIDFSGDAVEAVRKSGHRAIEGTLPHPELEAERFDLITMRSSLEHLPDPCAVLGAIRNLLDADGMLVIQVPNFASFEIEYFQDASLSLDLPRHLLHFTPETLRDLLMRCGFVVQSVKQVSRAGGLRKSLKQIERREPRRLDVLFRSKLFCQLAAWFAGRRGLGNELIAVAKRS